jgi:hypothetical protein
MTLMAVNDIRPYNFADDGPGQRVRPLAAHVPRRPDHSHFETSDVYGAITIAEGDEPGWNAIGHVPRELERVTLSAANDSVRPEQRRDQVKYVPGLLQR